MSLNRFLIRLFWLSILPLLLFVGFLVYYNLQVRHEEVESEAQNLAINAAVSIDRLLSSRIRGLGMLAAAPAAHEAHLNKHFYEAAQAYRISFNAHVILADLNGQMLFNTRVPEGTVLPKLPAPPPHGSAAFPQVLKTGKPAVGDVVYGPVVKEPLVAVAVPVKQGGTVSTVLLATITGSEFGRYLDDIAVPNGWVLSLHDSTGTLIARQSSSNTAGADNRVRNMTRFTARPQLTQWTATIEVPDSLLHAQLRNSLLALILAALVTVLLALLTSRFASRRLQKSIRALARPPVAGAPVEAIDEIAAAGKLIDEAIEQRMQAEDANRATQQRYIERLEKVFMSAVEVATNLGELRDPFNAGHQRRAAHLAAAIGAELGFDAQRQEGLQVAGFLYDIGKISVPAEILSRPAKLTTAEFDLVKSHCQASYDVLSKVEFPWPVAEAALQHHERLDGSGYPGGLKGDEILLEARVLGVADVVEAMCSHRPYRPARGIDKALEEIEGGRGTRYDATVVAACVRLFREKGYQLSG